VDIKWEDGASCLGAYGIHAPSLFSVCDYFFQHFQAFCATNIITIVVKLTYFLFKSLFKQKRTTIIADYARPLRTRCTATALCGDL
jgi:hypothetical protein